MLQCTFCKKFRAKQGLRLSLIIIIQSTRLIHPLITLQTKCSISIFSLPQQQNIKDNTFCKSVSRRYYPNLYYASPDTLNGSPDTSQIYIMPLLVL